MPGDEGKIETRCPACQARYRVPASSVGHHARCSRCRNSFLVNQAAPKRAPSGPGHPPTEDDILGWLNEGVDDEFLAPRPRIISGSDPVHPESHEEAPAQSQSIPSAGPRLPHSDTDLDSQSVPQEPLRKTG
jgi:predicted Zn finger-like uncharacterized protein